MDFYIVVAFLQVKSGETGSSLCWPELNCLRSRPRSTRFFIYYLSVPFTFLYK